MREEERYEEFFPFIEWRKPLPVSRPDGASGIACRYCVAMYGLRGSDVEKLFQTEEEHAQHLEQFHPTMGEKDHV